MRDFNNLVEALTTLKAEGYVYDFNLMDNQVFCKELGKGFMPSVFNVDEVLHFEGDDSSADTRSILYAISTSSGEKGVLLEAGGIYATDTISTELLEKLKIR